MNVHNGATNSTNPKIPWVMVSEITSTIGIFIDFTIIFPTGGINIFSYLSTEF